MIPKAEHTGALNFHVSAHDLFGLDAPLLDMDIDGITEYQRSLSGEISPGQAYQNIYQKALYTESGAKIVMLCNTISFPASSLLVALLSPLMDEMQILGISGALSLCLFIASRKVIF